VANQHELIRPELTGRSRNNRSRVQRGEHVISRKRKTEANRGGQIFRYFDFWAKLFSVCWTTV
jgi:hypothetical protein